MARVHRINGHVVGAQSDGWLRVEARSLASPSRAATADAIVGPDGSFSLVVAEARLRPDPATGRRAVYFRVLRDTDVLADTRDHVHWFVGDEHPVHIHCHPRLHHPSSTSGASSSAAPAPLVITGTVLEANGGPVAAALVSAFDKTLRHEVQIGTTRTGADGTYTIDYDPSRLAHRAGHPPDLLVRAYRPDGSHWGESSVRFRASSPAAIDVVVDGTIYIGFSELERVAQAMAPELDGVAAKDLTAADVAFLAQDCALPVPAVQAFADSARLSSALGVPQSVLYGLLREGEPADASLLAAVNAANLEASAAAALKANVVPASSQREIQAAIATITARAVAAALGDQRAPQPGALGPAISIAGAPRALQEQVLNTFRLTTASVPDTWKQLQAKSDPKQIAAVQLALQLGAVVRNHRPLVDKLSALVSSGQVKSLRDLTHFTRYDWQGMLAGAELPPDVPGSSPVEKQWNFAVTLERTVEDADPTGTLAARLASTLSSGSRTAPAPAGQVQLFAGGVGAAETKDLVQFFANSPDFVLDRSDVDKYLAQNPGAVSGVADVAGLPAALKTWQRVAKITPRVSEMQALVAAGYGSALSVVRAGKAGFAAAMTGTLDALRADIVFGNASQAAATALMLHTQFDPKLNTPNFVGLEAYDPNVVAPAIDSSGLPSYTTLFGSVDFCACDDCRSVGSPAAYLVDLLHHVLGSGFAQLDTMRPDIKLIQLSCVNANTPLPYIDLVNELLENAVASPPPPAAPPPPPAPPPAVWPNTGWTADELLASPEYVNDNAYGVLAAATFPWTLPFDRAAEEANVYLKHLGEARVDLMETFASPTSSAVATAGARLDMSVTDWDIVTGALADQPAFWGPSNGVPETNVAKLLQQTALTYDDLLDALFSDYVDPATAVTVTFPVGDCALTYANLTGTTPPFFARLHRFTRLRRRLGWTAFQLDAAIRTFAPADLTADFLVLLSDVEALREALRTDVDQLLACWGRIDVKPQRDGSASLYASVFQNKTVLDEDERATFAYDAATADLASAGTATCSDHEPAICGALGISSDDFALLTDAAAALTVGVAPEISDPALSLANLTRFYRAVTLAGAMGISLRALLALRALTGIDPFAGPATTRALVAALKQIRPSRFTLEELDELLRNVPPPGGSSFITPDAALVLLLQLQTGLLKIQQANTLVPDATGSVTRTALAAALPPAAASTIDTLIAIIAGSTALTLDANAQKAALEAALVPILGTNYVQTTIEPIVFPAGPPSPSLAARFQVVLEGLLPYLQQAQSIALCTTKLAAQFGLEAGSTAALLGRALLSPSTPGQPAIQDFLDPTFVGAPSITTAPGDAVFQKLYRTLLLISKASFLVARFRLTYDELVFVLPPDAPPLVAGSDARVGWVPLDALPLDPPAGPVSSPLFAAWSRQSYVFAFRDRFRVRGAGALSLFAIAADATKTLGDLEAAVCAVTGWASTDLATLAGSTMLSLGYPADFYRGETYDRLTRCMDALSRLGVSAERALPWAYHRTLTAAEAADVKTAAKAKYDPGSWPAVAHPLADALRTQQRDALAAWLVGNKQYADANALFDAFLIDTQMCPCMLTSRIKQAIGSTQLFIQRALMGDPRVGVKLTPDQAAQWQSFEGRYRLWQANREVFLYPENWLDPTLRDDKTPFFVDFEDQLNQSPMTSASAEEAFRRYLEDLQAVSRLQVVAVYHDDLEQTVHVLARTQEQASRYFYRTRVGAPFAYWTPWQKVGLDISGDHIVLVVWNRRVHVVWALFTEQAVNGRPTNMPDPTKGPVGFPETNIQIQLAISEYKQGKWTPKQTTTEWVTSSDLALDNLTLKTRLEADDRGGEDLVVAVTSPGGLFDNCFRFPSYGGHAFIFMEPPKDATLPSALAPVAQWLVGEASGPLPLETALVGTTNVFGVTMTNYQLAMSHQTDDYYADSPFFFQDMRRVFFGLGSDLLGAWWTPTYVDPTIVSKAAAKLPYVVSPVPTNVNARPSADAQRISSAGETLVLPPTAARATALAVSDPYRAQRRIVAGLSADTATTPIIAQDLLAAPTYAFPWGAWSAQFQFWTFYHPYVADCLARLNRFGIDGLLNWDTQRQAKPKALLPVQLLDETSTGSYRFATGATQFQPGPSVQEPYPVEDFEFSDDGAYAQYNWEVFFHAPLMIATKLSQNQRFAEAQRWFHYIFNPTDTEYDLGSGNAHFWKVKKFFDDSQTTPVPPSVAKLLALLAGGASGPDVDALNRQIAAYRQDPFNPWAIARLRTVALQKATVMKYIDNLIAWGDNLFLQNTIESINEATLMYVLASEILGPRPQIITPPQTPQDTMTYQGLLSGTLDDFSNELVTLENYLPAGLTNYAPGPNGEPPQMLFFCVPPNDQILSYWDTVADRLFKIRNCMNIEGQVQQLPLFEPPINPALLVRAAAAGLDLSSVLFDSAAPLVPYRFQTLAQKATELVSDVRALGQALLAAMEKRDGEALAMMRAQQELDVLTLVRAVKQKAIDEAQAALDALNKSQGIAQQRQQYYDGLHGKGLSDGENQSIAKLLDAHKASDGAQAEEFMAAAFGTIPGFSVGIAGFSGSPQANISMGGEQLGAAARAMAGGFNIQATDATYWGNRAATTASYARRDQEWVFQSQMASLDADQIGKQIAAATIRLDIANTDLNNHDAQIQNATDVRDFLTNKFTNQALYDWMVTQLSATYFQSYQLAYDLAKKAERAYRNEVRDSSLANDPAGFIRFGYWDSLKQGLLAGESLHYDLKRMEATYLEKNRRELEITKSISIAQLDPVALVSLRQSGVCFVVLPEALFDADYPGHYLRRIRSASLTIPCTVGPYTSVNATLTLVRHRIRLGPDPNASATDPTAFEDNVAAIESIVTSSAQNDAGLFETNLRDERYLPFEGAGAVSLWRIELPPDTNAFDTTTVTDVVLHLRYTARDGGDPLRVSARNNLQLGQGPALPGSQPAIPMAEKPLTPLIRLFSAKRDYADALYRFLNPEPSANGQALALDLSDSRFPYHDPAKTVGLSRVRFFLLMQPGSGDPSGLQATLMDPNGASHAAPGSTGVAADVTLAGLPALSFTVSAGAPGLWTLQVAEADIPQPLQLSVGGHTRISPSAIGDVGILCEYSV
jgi:hypothetical protein